MEYSENWIKYIKAESEFFAARYSLVQDEEQVIDDLRLAWLRIDDRDAALRLLSHVPLNMTTILPLFPDIIGVAVDSSSLTPIELARKTLCIYKDDPLARNAINTCISSYLPQNDDWNYRRIAELYDLLGYKEELNSFVLICLSNNNSDIKEIGEDYQLKDN